jgi:hypothetical protein
MYIMAMTALAPCGLPESDQVRILFPISCVNFEYREGGQLPQAVGPEKEEVLTIDFWDVMASGRHGGTGNKVEDSTDESAVDQDRATADTIDEGEDAARRGEEDDVLDD